SLAREQVREPGMTLDAAESDRDLVRIRLKQQRAQRFGGGSAADRALGPEAQHEAHLFAPLEIHAAFRRVIAADGPSHQDFEHAGRPAPDSMRMHRKSANTRDSRGTMRQNEKSASVKLMACSGKRASHLACSSG